jgi:hypothetical protein
MMMMMMMNFPGFLRIHCYILQHVDLLICNDFLKTPAPRKQIPNMSQWTDWKAVFSARSAPMAAHATMDTATEEWHFLCCP